MTTRSPDQRIAFPALSMQWLDMAFVHWAYPPDAIQRMLPLGLAVDRYADLAWVGLTPFTMAKVRAGGRLPLPGETFPETNLRTYVRGPRGRDGLWFFSLDTTHLLLTLAANALLGAPYRPARLKADETGTGRTDTADGRIVYLGRRTGGRAAYRIALRPGPALVAADLELWLTSRWRAYTRHFGLLWETPVEHEPWPLRSTTDVTVVQNMTAAAGLPDPASPPLVHFSEGVRRVRLGVTRPAG
ncbi:YqjF family protein [Kitasatospora sp. NPDC127111]|uniref:YqjF family protein n=1 Tax=Kitasatospora sp. NPDC127111 TaxID=3345363 RepID=UPI0036342495